MQGIGELHVRIVDARYFAEYQSFVLAVEDIETKKTLGRPLQVTRTTMLKIAGIDPANPLITDDLMHYYAKLLRERCRDNPVKLQWSEVDELTPAIQKSLEEANRSDEIRAGESFDNFKKRGNKDLFFE